MIANFNPYAEPPIFDDFQPFDLYGYTKNSCEIDENGDAWEVYDIPGVGRLLARPETIFERSARLSPFAPQEVGVVS